LKSNPNDLDVIPNAGYSIQDLMIDESWLSETLSLGAIYSFNSDWDLAADIASGFRAPTFSDVLSTGTPVFSTKVASVPNASVGPERSVTYELGPRYHTKKWSISLTGYWTELTDVVRAIPNGTVTIPGQGVFTAQRNTNAGQGYVRGIEFASAFKPSYDWTIFSNATYTESWDRNYNEYYRFIPPINGSIGARYEARSGRWWAEGVEVLVDRLRHHSPIDETDSGFSNDPGYGSPGPTNPPINSDFQIPGYALTNLRAGMTVWRDMQERVGELNLTIDNLLNASYREAYSQQQLVAPGINFIFGGRLKF
jgi:hemoglobin/transferrin/lactoferrin receptor protein